MPDDGIASRAGSTARCPICRASTEPRWRPFCSRRCADVDLGRWMTGAYAVPTEEELEDNSAAEE